MALTINEPNLIETTQKETSHFPQDSLHQLRRILNHHRTKRKPKNTAKMKTKSETRFASLNLRMENPPTCLPNLTPKAQVGQQMVNVQRMKLEPNHRGPLH